MEQHWCLEFVGGPLDGRKDISTPIKLDPYLYPASVALPKVTPIEPEPSPYGPSLAFHTYRQGLMAKRWTEVKTHITPHGPENLVVTSEVVWNVWQYHGIEK